MDGRIIVLPRDEEGDEVLLLEHRGKVERYELRRGVTFSRFWIGSGKLEPSQAPRRAGNLVSWIRPMVEAAARDLILLRLYDTGAGLREIGEQTGLSHEMVRRVLIEHGVPLRERGWPGGRPRAAQTA